MLSEKQQNLCANTLRFLAADAVQKANSGHPGAPMGMADMAFVVWNQFLRFQADDPGWVNRDRFVLSSGHASMLLYSLLHLAGYDLSLEDLKQFRQWESKTPGHPEYGVTPGVECTTGPLGAGISNAVGMALGSRMMAARFNSPESALIDSKVYVICGDGDLQEGISAEAASLAGHLGLGNLIVLYDSNQITIEGDVSLSMTENTGKRFEAYGWHVLKCDGHNQKEIAASIEAGLQVHRQPTLIIAETEIGKGAPNKAGTSSVHGAPLGNEEIEAAKKAADWPLQPDFHVPEEVQQIFSDRQQELNQQYNSWHEMLVAWKSSNPEKAQIWHAHWSQETPENILQSLIETVEGKEDATRNLSGQIIQKIAEILPGFIGGSADLEPSNKTLIKAEDSIRPASVDSPVLPDPSFAGRNIHFGIREHAMSGITNGLALFGGWKPYCGTFAVFSDYMRPGIRLAALSGLASTFVLTHDSYAVGEDGPTHQPVEHHWALRLIPELAVWRPSDALETAAAWAYSVSMSNESAHPNALLLTRQSTDALQRPKGFNANQILKGAYIVSDSKNNEPEVTLLSTGSEGGIVQNVRKTLEAKGVAVRHVSMPCVEIFETQPLEYQVSVLPPSAPVVVVEAGVTGPWYQFAEFVIGKETFGDSAPAKLLNEKYGFTAEQLTDEIIQFLQDEGIYAAE